MNFQFYHIYQVIKKYINKPHIPKIMTKNLDLQTSDYNFYPPLTKFGPPNSYIVNQITKERDASSFLQAPR